MPRISTVLIVIIFILFSFPSLLLAEMVSVSADDVNLRSGPGTNYPVKWRYGSGFPLKVLESKGKWIKVSDFENDIGWLYKDLVNHQGHMVVKVNKGTDTKINIRNGPGPNHKVIGMAHYGVVFKTVKQLNGWALVRHESGLEGWISRDLLWGF